MTPPSFDRTDWHELSRAFERCFAGKGQVVAGADEISFREPTLGTGLTLRRDGTSQSFMPLHGLEARWDRVVFDDEAEEIRLEGDAVAYTYRIPTSPP